MTYDQLKSSLLNTGYFIANDYLTMYVKLCLENIDTAKQNGKTNRHHTIPLAWYIKKYGLQTRREAEPLAKNDKNNLLVNLLFKDHIIAHYYLCLCSTEKFKYQAMCALNYLLGNSKKIYNLATLQVIVNELNLVEYQHLYEEHSKLNALAHTGIKQKRTAEWNKNISKGNTGKVKINKDGAEKAVDVSELQKYLELGWSKGIVPYTEERKALARKSIQKAVAVSSKRNKGENNPAKRPEVREKISKALTGRKPSAETIEKMRKTKTGKRNPKKAKPVTIAGVTYYGITEAMHELHVGRVTLQKLMELEQNENTK